MATDFRLGKLVRTDDPDATRLWAATEGFTAITSCEELVPQMRAVVDVDVAGPSAAAEICARFRARGVHLAVATRPEVELPFAILRNLAG